MSHENPDDMLPPSWHTEYIQNREQALANGEDAFIDLAEFEAELRIAIDSMVYNDGEGMRLC